MKRFRMSLFVMFFIMGTAGMALAGAHFVPPSPMDPKGIETVHMAYECDTFTPGKPNVHLPGAYLGYPGDMYRFTIIRDDKYANDPNYEIFQAHISAHIDDYDVSKDGGDAALEWGRILINGKTSTSIIVFPFDKRKPESSELLEMISDAEISPDPKQLFPPYIFDVTELAKQTKFITFEVMNLRKDGTIDSNAPFGNFVVNRIGSHVWYKKK